MRLRQTGILLITALCFSLVVFGVWRWSYINALDQLERQGSASLSLASDRLVSMLERYRILPVALASDDIFVSALEQGNIGNALTERLQSLADMTGAQHILLADIDGNIVAGSLRFEGETAMPKSVANRPDFIRAMNGALGFYHAQEQETTPRGFMFASAIRNSNGEILGALIINSDLEALEFHWRGDPEIIFFTDQNNVIFVANRDNLILRVLGNPSAQTIRNLYQNRYTGAKLRKLASPQETINFGRVFWDMSDVAGIQGTALLINQPLPVIGMKAHILLDMAPVIALAKSRAILAAVLLALLAMLFWLLQMRRQALADQLVIRKEANARLEQRVLQRTAELSDANLSLRQAQDDLVQAGKLAALGEMSAGISHELNQPLSAIQSFSENAAVLLERGQIAKTKENLGRIAALTGRMSRIIKNLRSFARKEGEVATDVSLCQVVDDTLEIARTSIDTAKVTVNWQRPKQNIMVRGGPVRLQQVLLNLVSNAIDAMEGMVQKTIDIKISRDAGSVLLIVHDSGPGLVTPEKIFDPFYTTKSVNHPQGMGLGLSISYGIVQSFGGNITGKNHPQGGAVFTVRLDAAPHEKMQI
ncbi:MAG: ATP-binding protein [Rhodobacteraceae bacterium]|nr:ATP-binding protein [Paracoccaceae bacterium]